MAGYLRHLLYVCIISHRELKRPEYWFASILFVPPEFIMRAQKRETSEEEKEIFEWPILRDGAKMKVGGCI